MSCIFTGLPFLIRSYYCFNFLSALKLGFENPLEFLHNISGFDIVNLLVWRDNSTTEVPINVTFSIGGGIAADVRQGKYGFYF